MDFKIGYAKSIIWLLPKTHGIIRKKKLWIRRIW